MKIDLRSIDKIKVAWVAGSLVSLAAAIVLGLYSSSYSERYFSRVAQGTVTHGSTDTGWEFVRRGTVLGRFTTDGTTVSYVLLARTPDRLIVPLVLSGAVGGPGMVAMQAGSAVQGRASRVVSDAFVYSDRLSRSSGNEAATWYLRSLIPSVNLTMQTIIELDREDTEDSDGR